MAESSYIETGTKNTDTTKELTDEEIEEIALDLADAIAECDFQSVQLIMAANREHIKPICSLLLPCDLSWGKDGEISVLHLAAMMNQLNFLNTIIHCGVPVDLPDSHGLTPLMYAVIKDTLNSARVLLDYNADVNKQDYNGYSSFHHSVQLAHIKMTEMLLLYGATVNTVQGEGWSPLMLAVRHRYERSDHIIIMKILFHQGALLDIQEKQQNYTALILAAQEGHLDIVKLLVRKGANVNLQTKSLHTALMLACWRGLKPIAEFLMARGANVDMQDNGGMTALMLALRDKHNDIANTLLQNRASVYIENKQKKLARHYTKSKVMKQTLEQAELDQARRVHVPASPCMGIPRRTPLAFRRLEFLAC
ncbi:unnamed protein product [Owenia fusiformis]|uniref:Uncharacterized protein n=1 Tax=Owenia fusiformis TaxID=6347 RepID=A0A8J1Y2S4_OWEFU|nr:unnamed protein product [Owenia fusiformis]